MARAGEGIIYLIHFEAKIAGHAGHYLGFVEEDLVNRIGEHRTGQGSKLMAEVTRLEIPWRLVATWRGDRHFERKLKNKHGSRLCPVCNPNGRSKYDGQRTDVRLLGGHPGDAEGRDPSDASGQDSRRSA